MDKRGKHRVELLEVGEDAAKSLQATEQPFDLVAAPVDRLAVVTVGDSVRPGRHHRSEAQVKGQLVRLVTLVGPFHYQLHVPIRTAERNEKRAPLGGVVRMSGRQGKRNGR